LVVLGHRGELQRLAGAVDELDTQPGFERLDAARKAGCETCRRLAAAEKLPASSKAM
jgi:hypothetical protein